MGWLGVALTGSDTSSNALFGSLQRITSQQLGIDPILMCAANSAGGVMGKMVDAQSITIATAATEQVGNEGIIFRFVFWHSIALGAIVGLIVMLYAYVFASADSSRADVREVRNWHPASEPDGQNHVLRLLEHSQKGAWRGAYFIGGKYGMYRANSQHKKKTTGM